MFLYVIKWANKEILVKDIQGQLFTSFRDLLPPKKMIGSKDPSFIMKRRRELESYLKSICHFLERNLPPALSQFLCLELYSLHHVIQQLAELTHQEQEPGLQQVTWTPLEMFAVTERLQTPCPPQVLLYSCIIFEIKLGERNQLPHLAGNFMPNLAYIAILTKPTDPC